MFVLFKHIFCWDFFKLPIFIWSFFFRICGIVSCMKRRDLWDLQSCQCLNRSSSCRQHVSHRCGVGAWSGRVGCLCRDGSLRRSELLSGPSLFKRSGPALPLPTRPVHGLLLFSRFVFASWLNFLARGEKIAAGIIYVPLQGRRGHNLTNVWGQLVRTAFCCVPCAEVGSTAKLCAEVKGGGYGKMDLEIISSFELLTLKLDVFQSLTVRTWTPDEFEASVVSFYIFIDLILPT